MAAITPTNVYRESVGSLTLLMVDLTLGSSSDTYVLPNNSPVVRFWGQSSCGIAGAQEPDITWTPSTGTFLFSSGTVQATTITLFVLQRT